MIGTVKSLFVDKGFGFIRGEEGKDYFMHYRACKNCKIEELGIGQEVRFEDAEGSKGPRAEDVYV